MDDASDHTDEITTARQRRAEQTRIEVLEAAREVFAEQGYEGASMAAIAARAGVAVQTIYSSVGTKAHLLVALVDHIRHQARVPELDRSVVEAADPVDAFRTGARMPPDVLRFGADVFRLIRDVAPFEPEVAEVWSKVRGYVRTGVESAIRRLDELGALREELSVDEAVDIVVASAGVEAAFTLLDLGWDHDAIGDLFERLGTAMVVREDCLPSD